MLSFGELTDARRSLYSFCLLHEPSILRLQSGISFKLLPSDRELGREKVRHLTTTATCLSSLLDCPPRFQTERFNRVLELKAIFAERALAREFDEWISEGSAGVYCRCRALPLVIQCSELFDRRIKRHIAAILGQLDRQPERYAIGEAGPALPEEDWYPPNAFHTYWTLDIFDRLATKYPAKYEYFCSRKVLDIGRRREGMLLWARQRLGYEIGLHSPTPPSSVLDSDQLAWSLAIFLRFDEYLHVDLENRDFLKQAFKSLFSTQTDGTWRHYKPLFHYRKAGNAYCYVFETFAVLLQCSLRIGDRGEMLRDLLKPYCKNLIDLWRYAESTKIDLRQYRATPNDAVGGRREYGWCSGHRTNVTEPESWATASVFSYAQALRRLIGIWCREEALASRKTPGTRRSADVAAKDMIARGSSWGKDKPAVVEQLWTMFINPVLMRQGGNELEPDSQPINEHQARSAILFGPPGASKTTLVRRLADVIGWDYVEIHASHFVAEGLPEVQKTADQIFKQLLELDHAVVLFDEIDELVRERDMEKDAFGRFLTTSMLPKLAELWENRKIIYFVATNHINYFDSAIIRSHRFDALILVSPPSFAAKVQRVRELLTRSGTTNVEFSVTENDVEEDLEKVRSTIPNWSISKGPAKPNAVEREAQFREWAERELSDDMTLAKFALIRWDELDELAYRLSNTFPASSSKKFVVSKEVLRTALKSIRDSQWRKNKSYADYARDENSERRDYQMAKVWEVNSDTPGELRIPGISSSNGRKWLARTVDSLEDIRIPGYKLLAVKPGVVKIKAAKRKSQPSRKKVPPRKRKRLTPAAPRTGSVDVTVCWPG